MTVITHKSPEGEKTIGEVMEEYHPKLYKFWRIGPNTGYLIDINLEKYEKQVYIALVFHEKGKTWEYHIPVKH